MFGESGASDERFFEKASCAPEVHSAPGFATVCRYVFSREIWAEYFAYSEISGCYVL